MAHYSRVLISTELHYAQVGPSVLNKSKYRTGLKIIYHLTDDKMPVNMRIICGVCFLLKKAKKIFHCYFNLLKFHLPWYFLGFLDEFTQGLPIGTCISQE